MLKTSEKLNITGESIVGETVVCSYSVLIDKENPEKMIINQIQRDKEAYKENRAICRADFAAFEDLAYSRQSEIAAAMAKEEKDG